MDTQNLIKNADNAEPIKITDGKINFKNISFKYNKDEKNVLDNVNLEFDGGKMTALVGHSGSGKSTILNLIQGFTKHKREILIDEQLVDKCTIGSLRNHISLVTQETTLFDDTIKNNIKHANESASDHEIMNVAKLSNSHDFIDKLQINMKLKLVVDLDYLG